MTQTVHPVCPEPLVSKMLRSEFEDGSLARSLELAGGPIPDRLWQEALFGPLRDFFQAAGKQFRARLVELAYDLSGGVQGRLPHEATLVVEMLHAGSLIVDDVQDGSHLRRGRPSLHAQVGVPLAINSGNWLYFWSLTLLSRMGLTADVERGLSRAAIEAVLRCHYGQALDLTADVTTLEQHEVPGVVSATTELKTGSLFELAAILGATVAGASEREVACLGPFGRAFGVELQMLDDLSGLVDARRRHKGIEDLREGRPTWPWAWLSTSLDREAFSRLQLQGRDLAGSESKADLLADELRENLADRGRSLAQVPLRSALANVKSQFGNSPALRRLCSEVERLEDGGV